MKELVIYHKNCLDGIASAMLYDMIPGKRIFKDVQHGTKDKDNFLENLTEEELSCTHLVILDFSLDIENSIKADKHFDSVLIIDHHKTFGETISEIMKATNNTVSIYTSKMSGAGLTLEYVQSKGINVDEDTNKVVQHIQDRDLWTWKISGTKEVTSAIKTLIGDYDIPDYIAMERVIEYNTVDELFSSGSILAMKDDQSANSKADMKKLRKITLSGIDVLAVNSTDVISETGNAICKLHDKVACMYFILDDNTVVMSLRSMDHLPDASKIAKHYGGGGHRNACGFKLTLSELVEVLSKE